MGKILPTDRLSSLLVLKSLTSGLREIGTWGDRVADAGSRKFFCFFNKHFTNWIPAFAGMTNMNLKTEVEPF